MKPAKGLGQTESIYSASEMDKKKKMMKMKPKMKQMQALSNNLKK